MIELIKQGDIAFSKPINPGFYSKSVMYFTNSNWSHCFLICPEYLETLMVIEADVEVQLVSFKQEYIDKQDDIYYIFRPIAATEEEKILACKKTILEMSGKTYGFLQIPWFAIRETLKKLTGLVLTKNINTSGIICSELVIYYLKSLNSKYNELFKDLKIDETSPEDIFRIVENSELFEKVLIKQ